MDDEYSIQEVALTRSVVKRMRCLEELLYGSFSSYETDALLLGWSVDDVYVFESVYGLERLFEEIGRAVYGLSDESVYLIYDKVSGRVEKFKSEECAYGGCCISDGRYAWRKVCYEGVFGY